MEKNIYRQQLVDNMCQICKYMENELAVSPNSEFIKYEHGFIYGWSHYNICLWYSASSKRAALRINFYHGHDYRFENGKIYHLNDDTDVWEDMTDSFVNHNGGHFVEEAITITLNRWESLKREIADRKQAYHSAVNFHL